MFSPWLPFEWIVAIRFLREGRLQTVFIIAGVAIGVGVIDFMSSLLSGLQSNFIRRVLATQSHIQLLQPQQITRPLRNGPDAPRGQIEGSIVQPPLQQTKSINQWQTVVNQVRAMEAVKVVSPVASGPMLVVRGSAIRSLCPESSRKPTFR